MREKEKPVWITESVHLPAKISAVKRGIGLKTWICEAIQEKLDREEALADKKEPACARK